MTRLSRLLTAAAAAALLSAPALAEVYTNERGERVECHQEQTTTTEEGVDPTTGAIAGAAIGGVAGHQFGSGKGKTAATAAGAVGGAVVGHEMAEGKRTETSTQVVCRRL